MVAQAHARLKGSQLLRRVVSQRASPTCEIEQIADYGQVCLVHLRLCSRVHIDRFGYGVALGVA